MSTVYLGLGSNVDAEANIASCIAELRRGFGAVALSPLYRAAAVGFAGDDFINAVARIETNLCPVATKRWLQALEDRHGRTRGGPKLSDRTLDVDILLYDDLWLLSPELELPRGEILVAAYVLRPLADLAPALIHPVTGRRIDEHWRDYPGSRANLRQIH